MQLLITIGLRDLEFVILMHKAPPLSFTGLEMNTQSFTFNVNLISSSYVSNKLLDDVDSSLVKYMPPPSDALLSLKKHRLILNVDNEDLM